jgi:GTP-binding protein HflX
VLHPNLRSERRAQRREPAARLDEARGLAEAIELDIRIAEIVNVTRLSPATYFGSGAVERMKERIAEEQVEIAVVDTQLSPVQQQNLERAWKCKVIDRTGLILEIFGERARTREGSLQVELAALSYQRTRLVRAWTHLERQRGGFGFLGGPGETQIEADRRAIDQRIMHLKNEIADVRRTRGLHRKARKQGGDGAVVALVGYTNAGKSTLFNRLTNANVEARDQLFATLDPTMRAFELPSGRSAILSDTVGFVSDLPHELVEAFQATLEEVREADVLVHVRDAAHPDTEAQKEDVEEVLAQIRPELSEGGDETPVLEALNKVDLLSPEMREVLANRAIRGNEPAILISAASGAGIDVLTQRIDDHLGRRRRTVTLMVPWSEGAELARIYQRGEVLERRDLQDAVEITVRLEPADAERLERRLKRPQ